MGRGSWSELVCGFFATFSMSRRNIDDIMRAAEPNFTGFDEKGYLRQLIIIAVSCSRIPWSPIVTSPLEDVSI